MPPRYATELLAELQAHAQARKWKPGKTRGYVKVMEVLDCDYETARDFMLDGFLQLEPGDISMNGPTKTLDDGRQCVVCGKRIQGIDWYISGTTCEEGCFVISFHLPEKQICCYNGNKINP